jgi:hypothetical protein
MYKSKKLWIKQEKRIVKLLYKKGLLKSFKLSDFYWAEYTWFNKKCYHYKNAYSDKKYRSPLYMPEVHFMTTDYWGGSDEQSITSTIKDLLYWENIDVDNWDETTGEYPKSTFPKMNRRDFIKYLEKLPTVIPDNKINKVIKKINLI